MAFALGSIASLISVLAASQIGDEQQNSPKAFRTVFAPDIIPPSGEFKTSDNVAFKSGEVIRECELSEFQVNLGDLHGLTYDLEITKDNIAPLQCIDDKVRSVDEGIKLGFKVQ